MFEFGTADAARSLMLQRTGRGLKSTVSKLTAELSSGQRLDKSQAMNGALARLAHVEHGLELSARHASNAAFLSTILNAQQGALDRLGAIATELSVDFQISKQAADPSAVAQATERARDGFTDAIGILNTKVAGRFVFSGAEGQQRPFADPQTILDTVAMTVPPGASASDIRDHVMTWFASGGGFDTLAYQGGAAATSATELGSGIAVRPDISGTEQAIRETLAGLAISALGATLAPSLTEDHQRDLLGESAAALLAADTSRVGLQARVGTMQERVDTAQTQAQAQASVLTITRNDLLAADPYETATALEAATQRLDALYVVTARLSRLSLTEYLR